MAASLVSDPYEKVNKREYMNWMKLNLALLYGKIGIHDFIEKEVNNLHANLKKSIYGDERPNRCSTCKSENIIWNGSTWKFQMNCYLDCARWLQELTMLVPKTADLQKMYWINSYVQEWPFKPWQCAKIFLPKGQPRSNTGPDKSDSQALMTLLANCEHFRKKLSKEGLNLACAISKIRNKVMHNPILEVSEDDMTKGLQHIIKFLEDQIFKSVDECKTAIEKIQKMWKAEYTIVLQDENKAKLFYLQEQLGYIRMKMAEQDEKDDRRFLQLETEIQSIRDLFETLDSSEEMQNNIKENIDKALAEWNDTMKEHGERIAMLENGLGEVEGKVDYLLNKDPEYRERESAKRYVEELKSNTGWDPQSDDAVKELVKSAQEGKLFQCKLLIQEHVKMGMKELPDVVNGVNVTLEILRFIIQYLKNIKRWDSRSRYASVALDNAFAENKIDLFDQLHFQGVQTAEESD